jgi:hypothetical protein
MNGYLEDLYASSLPFPHWVALLLWLVSLAVVHFWYRKARMASSDQGALGIDGVPTPQNFRLVAGQLAFGAAVFAASYWLDDPYFTFFFGGLLISTLVSVAGNIRSYLFLSAIRAQGAAEGRLVLSPSVAIRDQAYHLATWAFTMGCAGAIIGNVALFGAALFLGSTAAGYARRASAAA